MLIVFKAFKDMPFQAIKINVLAAGQAILKNWYNKTNDSLITVFIKGFV